MSKRGAANFILYTIGFVLIGIVVMMAMFRLGSIGQSDNWIRLNLVRNIALTPQTFKVMSGNVGIKGSYDFANTIFQANSTFIRIYQSDDDSVKNNYGYRWADFPRFKASEIADFEIIEVQKTDSIYFNKDKNLDSLVCIYEANVSSIPDIFFTYTGDFNFELSVNNQPSTLSEFDFSKNIAETARNNLKSLGFERSYLFDNKFSAGAIDSLHIVISTEKEPFKGNNLVAYVPIQNRTMNSLACNIINALIEKEELSFDTITVIAIDPELELVDSKRIDNKTIYLEIGNLGLLADSDDNVYYKRPYIAEGIAEGIVHKFGLGEANE